MKTFKQPRDRLPLLYEERRKLHIIIPGPLDDNTLIKMALAGETEYFSVLMDRHLGALTRCMGSNGQEQNRRGRAGSGCPIEDLAPIVDVSVRSRISHVDDSRRHQ